MSNFGVLFKYELKKIFSQKAYWCALVILLGICLLNEVTPVLLGNYKREQERMDSINGTTINDEFLNEIKTSDDHNKYYPLDFFLMAATGKTDFTDITEQNLYETRLTICEGLMTQAKVSEKEKEYWRYHDSQISTPYYYEKDVAYMDFIEMAGYLNFMVIILCATGLAGIFADEKQKNTDQLIFCSKYGKTSLFNVKLVVGLIMGVMSSAILVIVNIISCIAFNGVDGFNNAIQVHIPTCMMDITMGEACIGLAIIIILLGGVIGVFTMFASLITMNHPVTIGIMIMYMFLSMFNLPDSLGLLSTLGDMNPGVFAGSWVFEGYRVLTFGKHGLTLIQYAPIAWLLIVAIFIAVAMVRYRKYEVKSR